MEQIVIKQMISNHHADSVWYHQNTPSCLTNMSLSFTMILNLILYIVMCQTGGVSSKPTPQRATTSQSFSL